MTERKKGYNPKDAKSVFEYGKKLVGKTFGQIIEENADQDKEELVEKYSNKSRKGGLGNLIEEVYFGYEANTKQEADFSEAGVELKTTPYEKGKKGALRAGERLVLTKINFNEPVEDDFYKSHAWEKMKSILLIHYLRDKSLESNLSYVIDYVNLFSPPEADLEIIKRDYEFIINKIKEGLAHELSEGDTMYLGACTKGATAEKSVGPQYYGDKIPAKNRAFCLKTSYMTYVLNHYIAGEPSNNSILNNVSQLKEKTFEQILKDIVDKYVGKTDKELCQLFGRKYNNNKAQWNDLVCRILGIRDEHADEFEKANISIKTIRIEENGNIRENMSFKTFRFMELAEEEFEESSLYNLFFEKRYFFVVWKKVGDEYKLQGCQLWNMPYNDLNVIVRREWEACQKVVRDGVQFKKKVDRSGKISFENNFPNKSETEIIHIRPHAKKAAYRFKDGREYGNVEKDANMLPNGEYMTTQSFWLNNDYVLKQLKI